MPLHFSAVAVADHRPHVRARVQAVAQAQCAELLAQPLRQRGKQVGGYVDALRGGADLPRIDECRVGECLNRPLDVGVGGVGRLEVHEVHHAVAHAHQRPHLVPGAFGDLCRAQGAVDVAVDDTGL